MLGVSVADLRQLKRDGCPHFRDGKIYVREIVRWLRDPSRCVHGPLGLDLVSYRRNVARLDALIAAGVVEIGARGCYDAAGKLIPRSRVPAPPSAWCELPKG